MKRQIVGFWVIGALAMLVSGGCASKEVVKSDEQLKPTVATQTTQTKPVTVPSVKTDAATDKQNAVKPATMNDNKQKEAATAKMSGTESLKAALEKIYFDFDSANLSEKARSSLTTNAAYLKKNPNAKISIEGNCDERGSEEYNLALGEKRAKAAAKYLTTMGIAEDRIATISYGKEKPADPGHDEAAWTKNRRDEFVLQSK